MALTPKRLFLYLCISISLLRPYTLFSRSPLVNKTLFYLNVTVSWTPQVDSLLYTVRHLAAYHCRENNFVRSLCLALVPASAGLRTASMGLVQQGRLCRLERFNFQSPGQFCVLTTGQHLRRLYLSWMANNNMKMAQIY